MPKLAKVDSRLTLTPASQMAFAVSACAFTAAAVGTVVNYWLTGWMAVGGMVGVGLFYLAIGVLNLRSRNEFDDDDLITNISERTARSDNLYAEAVIRQRTDSREPQTTEHLRISTED